MIAATSIAITMKAMTMKARRAIGWTFFSMAVIIGLPFCSLSDGLVSSPSILRIGGFLILEIPHQAFEFSPCIGFALAPPGRRQAARQPHVGDVIDAISGHALDRRAFCVVNLRHIPPRFAYDHARGATFPAPLMYRDAY